MLRGYDEDLPVLVRIDHGKRWFIYELLKNTKHKGTFSFVGYLKIDEGEVISNGVTKEDLKKKLVELCILKLDFKIHEDIGESLKLFKTNLFIN